MDYTLTHFIDTFAMKKNIFISLLLVFLSVTLTAQTSLPEEYAYKIKKEAFQNSKIEALSQYMTDYLGSRLASSKQWERTEELTANKLKELGFENVRIEYAADFAKGGWDNLKTYVAMTAPYYCHFFGTPKAWSGSTDGLVQGEVVLVNPATLEEVEALKGKLTGKIVLMPETSQYQMRFEPFASRYSDQELEIIAKDPRPTARRTMGIRPGGAINYEVQMKLRELMMSEKPAVIISGSGSFNVPRSSSVQYKSGDPEPTPEIVLSLEGHGLMVRLIKNKIPVSMEVEIKNQFNPNLVVNNIIAEIPGTDPKLKEEVVLIGGHLDSWHGGTGAADNASGCIVMIEALRIIKESGIKPKRTIRVALWGGEEQGLIGSRGYLQTRLYDTKNNKAKKEFDKFALYLNMDNGSGKFRGIYLEENDMAVPFWEAWMKALESMDFKTITLRRTGGTDHMTFDRYGLPAYQFIQDELEYDRAYHTAMDTYERLLLPDLQYNAAVAAWIALSAAMDDNKIPLKPVTIQPQVRR